MKALIVKCFTVAVVIIVLANLTLAGYKSYNENSRFISENQLRQVVAITTYYRMDNRKTKYRLYADSILVLRLLKK